MGEMVDGEFSKKRLRLKEPGADERVRAALFKKAGRAKT